jgi:uncharacterized cupredoxin-like copper-binding protein
MKRRGIAGAIFVVSLLLLAACGDDGSESGSQSGSESSTEQSDAPEGEPEEHDEDVTFGESADAADADRVVEVTMNDDFSFDPATIDVAAGETITFKLVNGGVIGHDFTIGDDATQDAHEIEMAEMADMDMEDEDADMDMESEDEEGHGADSNAVTVAAGEQGELTWTFADAGETILFGCHEPGHYDAGMVGDFNLG